MSEEPRDVEPVTDDPWPGEPAPDDAGGGRPHARLAVLSLVLASLVLLGAVLAPVVVRLAGYQPVEPDLSAVRTWQITDRRHTEGDVRYGTSPPAGGPHHPVWLDCGTYEEPVREENAVHDLEHGTVWIAYQPSLSETEVEQLEETLPDNGILAPYDGLPSPVVVTVWGAQLGLDGADDPRLELFMDKYGDGHTAPELGVSCHGGTPDPRGGTGEPGVEV